MITWQAIADIDDCMVVAFFKDNELFNVVSSSAFHMTEQLKFANAK
ncbi:hypothetical protein [Virgibacillus alimentarius]|nr:hypothetical protein [Virgibacillus alimentarius]